jgi:isoleucyl-tRNA synthetase
MLDFTTEEEELVDHEIVPLLHILGKKYGSLLPKLCEALVDLDADSVLQTLKEHQRVRVKVDNNVITILPEEFEVHVKPKEDYEVVGEEDIIVGVYTKITDDLKKEGLAREIVRRIQNQRKEARFAIADNIKIYYEAESILTEVFETYEKYIAAETLATSVNQAEIPNEAYISHYKIEEKPMKIGVIRTKDE